MSAITGNAVNTLVEQVQQGMQFHAAGQLDEAEQIYRRVLAQAPQQPDALHLLGLVAAQYRDFDRAHDLIRLAIVANPDEAMFHNNLANVCVERGDLVAAEGLYRRATELDGSRLDAMNNLGLLLGNTQRPEDAERLLRQVVEQDPTNPDWRQNLAGLYLRLGRDNEALAQCDEGLVVAPRDRTLRGLLATAYLQLGMIDKAVAVLKAWIASEPDDPYPRHHLAACTGEQVPTRATDAYVTGMFDSFARSFDAKLADLSYQAPALVAAEVARQVGAPAKALDVLDAGCGTGLCGPLLAPFARSLTGVDLSEGMLRKAVERRLYDPLIQGELVAFLASQPAAYDLVISADTLCYFGDLTSFAVAAFNAVRDGGSLVFTVEAHGAAAAPEPAITSSARDDATNTQGTLEGDSDTRATDLPDYVLRRHGRYSQSRGYVLAMLRGAGWGDAEAHAVILRNECGKPVEGWLVAARATSPH
jgi:predicted TPR repeat methyltransferase